MARYEDLKLARVGLLTVCSLNGRRLRSHDLFAISKESSCSADGCTLHSRFYLHFYHVVGVSFEGAVEDFERLHFAEFPAARGRIAPRIGYASREDVNTRRRKSLPPD